MQQDRQPRRGIERLAIHADGVVVDRIIGIQHLARGVGDASLAEHPLHLFAAAVAEVGDVLDDLHALTASP
ncbi:hypothetical protein D9M69_723070 [compost metagenome]